MSICSRVGRGSTPAPARGLHLLGDAHPLQHRQHHAHPSFGQGQRHGQVADRNFLALVAPGVKALGHRAGLVLGRVRFLQEVLLDRDVVGLEQQHATGRLVVAPGAPGLLDVRLRRAGHLVVDDVADVRLVDAQAEGVGGDHHHLAPGRHERRLRLLALVGGHLAVVALDRDLAVAKRHVKVIHRTDRGAVDDARAPQPLNQLAQHPQLVRLPGHFPDVEGEIRTVEGDADDLGVLHPHLHHHVFRHRRGGGGGQPQDGGTPQHLGGAPQPQVGRAKVVTPLGHAVGLVHGEQRKFHPVQLLLDGRGTDRFGGDEDQLDLPLADQFQVGRPLLGGASRVDPGHGDPLLLQLGDLILDQGQQRGDHQGRAFQHQGRQLVGHRLAAAGRQDGQRVPASQHRFDDRGLARSQLTEAEDLLQLDQRGLQGRRGGPLIHRGRFAGDRCNYGDDRPLGRFQRTFGLLLRRPDDERGLVFTGRRAGAVGRGNRRRFPACVGTQSLLLWENLVVARRVDGGLSRNAQPAETGSTENQLRPRERSAGENPRIRSALGNLA